MFRSLAMIEKTQFCCEKEQDWFKCATTGVADQRFGHPGLSGLVSALYDLQALSALKK